MPQRRNVRHAEKKSPKEIVGSDILDKLTEPLPGGRDAPSRPKQGLYVIVKKTDNKKMYVGKSVTVEKRIKDHERYVRKGKDEGAGRFIDEISDMEYCIIEFPKKIDPKVPLEYYEQELIDLLRKRYDMQNRKRAMNKEKFDKLTDYIDEK